MNMNNNQQNSNKIPTTQEERKQYAIEQAAKFLESYPDLKLDKKSLKPTLPPKLSNVDLSSKQMAKINFDPVQKSILCATIICDSSFAIDKGYANARIQMRHSTRQTDWFMWKCFYAFPKVTPNSIVFQKPDGFQANSHSLQTSPLAAWSSLRGRSNALSREHSMQLMHLGGEKQGEILGKWKVSSGATAELTALHSIICGKGCKKEMKRSWLNHMNDYFLMTIWLDDGGLVGYRQGVIAFYYLTKAELNVFADYMLSVWDIKCNVIAAPSRATKTNPNPFQINIADLDNLEKLLRIIAPIVPVQSMLYKVCLYPIESSRLQRWTAELKILVRQEWHIKIDQIYSDIAQEKI
jgi:hypothetical protein